MKNDDSLPILNAFACAMHYQLGNSLFYHYVEDIGFYHLVVTSKK